MIKLQSNLFKMQVYFSAKSFLSYVYSNYFLLGFRKKFVFIRLQALTEQLRKLAVFIKLNSKAGSDFWVVSFGIKYFKFVWWLTRLLNTNFLLRVNGRVFIFWWHGRCFMLQLGEYANRLRQLIGMDVIIAVGDDLTPLRTVGLISAGNRAPTIAICPPDALSQRSAFALYCSNKQPSLFIFYGRLLTILMSAS